MHVALITCTKAKKKGTWPAWELYSASDFFRRYYQFAKNTADKIFILSTEYGLVAEDQIIEDYDKDKNDMTAQEWLDWESGIVEALKKECNLSSDHFILLGAPNYYKFLFRYLPNHSCPAPTLNNDLSFTDKINKLDKWINESMAVATSNLSNPLR